MRSTRGSWAARITTASGTSWNSSGPLFRSNGFEPDGRPSTYRRALGLLETSRVKVGSFITHRYHSLDQVPAAFAGAHKAADYVKGVVLLCA